MKNNSIDKKKIESLLPHREPMLLIDKVKIIKPFVSAIGIKKIKKKDIYFKGHFPQKPIMPGVFIIEALAQTASVLVMHSLKMTCEDKLVYFMSLENAKFRKPVIPEDQIRFYVEFVNRVKNVYKSVGIQSENIWDGAKFEGPLVVHGEQGIGDEILYSSMFSDLKNYHDDFTIVVGRNKDRMRVLKINWDN